MKTIKFLTVILLLSIARLAVAQEMPEDVITALKSDDATKLASFVTKDNINNCYTEGDWQYSLLAQTVRYNAKKCFDLLIEKGADVNRTCNGYVPPLMHAAKYGRLEMIKILVAKGADINYKYSGDYSFADGDTPLTYAEKNDQKEAADYLRSLKPKK